MTDLRQAAQQALEALENSSPDQYPEDAGVFYDAITALKAALEQQAEPPPEWPLIKNILDEYGLQAIDFVAEFKAAQQVATIWKQPKQQAEPVALAHSRHAKLMAKFTENAEAMKALAQAEPVAYLCENAVGHKYFRWKKPSGTYKPIALYTAPPQRKELSASEILNMMPSAIPAEYDGPLMEFARAVEAKLKERNT